MTALSRTPAAIRARSVAFYLLCVASTLPFLPLLVLIFAPVRVGWPVLRAYFSVQIWLLRVVCGQRVRVTGEENLPDGPCLMAARHESAWETLYLPWRFGNPAVMLKRELLDIPLVGNIARKLKYIPIDRSGDLETARASFDAANAEVAEGRRILIFPAGTRDPAGRDAMQSGVAVLYRQLGLPCVPVTHNSGDIWPHRSWLRRPGEVEIRILPPIPPGEKTRVFLEHLGAALGAANRPGAAGAGAPVATRGPVTPRA
ncbi:lysophospholipid acyltransferase family protein [Psychromarinibacter sp. C21-152]|uniref:Lysophospholipid acyltransferase family protein n=1 Tax=Psychromarinibacter sediminicola TaxID=3033385 RepID=A0AAE3NT87_9RHOB|nr:lysophospholipid acyltransferase family protein [Psychromarinibacter sediminicola]MDF0601591.1 lysophospholipid acyltransferase family protein [Psychromarinibacter sediminicola]